MDPVEKVRAQIENLPPEHQLVAKALTVLGESLILLIRNRDRLAFDETRDVILEMLEQASRQIPDVTLN